MLEILAAPFVACLLLTGIHCYLGIHVVTRGVIFVDLALAQIAAFGAAVGTLFGFEPHTTPTYAFALGFTFVGAAVFALGRFRDRRVPQEAIIGTVYAVSSALAILVLSKIAVGKEEIEHMLVGRLLFVDWTEVAKTFAIYAAVAVVHIVLRRQFFAISTSAQDASKSGIRVRLLDFIFYMTFGIVVTSSVQMAGVLLVFSYLVVPAVCAMMFFRSISRRLLAAWGFGVLASAGGLVASAAWDLPTGASVVAAFGLLFLGCSATYAITESLRPTRNAEL
ncbi:MAG: metal ABC transporter permease [Planctomycetes bacterium]|nr:metal ABC transporter permease [Planctomycetota bacterium]